jgi:glycosyltransferase involved in cell wall biosynthesis
MRHIDPYYSFRILSYEPLITLSGCQTDIIFVAKMAEDLPEVFANKSGLHILLPTWNVEGGMSWQLKGALEQASKVMPGHRFLVVSSTEYETYLLGLDGVPAIFTHQGIFLDEEVWRPSEKKLENLGSFDAVYNARFDKIKRHELARGVDKLVLIYAASLEEKTDAAARRIKTLLPGAYFANHEQGKGTYAPLNTPAVVQLYGHARVGLCLSREEGYSRVSIEYMMCGLPVVSTASIGGRDRYYSNEYCKIVDDDETAIARAVRQLMACNYSAHEVRNNLLRLLKFERCNFLRAINRVVENHVKCSDFFSSIEPFIGIKQWFRSHNELLGEIKGDLAHRRSYGNAEPGQASR